MKRLKILRKSRRCRVWMRKAEKKEEKEEEEEEKGDEEEA